MKRKTERSDLYKKYYCKVEFLERKGVSRENLVLRGTVLLHDILKLLIINWSTLIINKLYVASSDRIIVEQ
jgi:hypothetical protein